MNAEYQVASIAEWRIPHTVQWWLCAASHNSTRYRKAQIRTTGLDLNTNIKVLQNLGP
jgi:hypothetical protein